MADSSELVRTGIVEAGEVVADSGGSPIPLMLSYIDGCLPKLLSVN